MADDNNGDAELVELLDEGLPSVGPGYWSDIDSSLQSIAASRTNETPHLGATGDAERGRRGFGVGPLLIAASVALLAGIGFFMLRGGETATPIDVIAPPPTSEPALPTTEPEPRPEDPTPAPPPTAVPTAPPEDEHDHAPENPDASWPFGEAVTSSIDDAEAEELLLRMFLTAASTDNAAAQIGNGLDREAMIHVLDPQLDRDNGECNQILANDRYRAGLFHNDPVATGGPETLLLLFLSPADARAANELILAELELCFLLNTRDFAITAMTPVDEIFAGFPLAGVVIDGDFRGSPARTVHLIHDRFLGRMTISSPNDAALREAADDLAAMLLAGGITEADVLVENLAVTDRGDVVEFSVNPGWVAYCSDDDGVPLVMLYAGQDYLELLQFQADLDAGVYGPDNPPPPELQQRLEEARVVYSNPLGGDEPLTRLLPDPPSSFMTIEARFLGSDPAAPSDLTVFVLDSQGQPWLDDDISSDEAGEFATRDLAAVEFAGEPCAPDTDTVSFSVDAVVPEEFSPRADWVRVVAMDQTAEIINR